MKKKETVGKIAYDLMQKETQIIDPIEQTQEVLTEYDKHLIETLETGLKKHDDIFYVIVIFKTEPLMPNVIRNYFFTRNSCPTPDYDQVVYKVNPHQHKIDFLWTVPDKKTCEFMIENAVLIPKSESDLLNFVLSFNDGTLLQLCKQLNGETEHTGQLILH